MSILKMSVSGTVMILVIVVIRALAIHKLPKKTFLALWGITLVRLLVPYSLPSAFSMYSLLGGSVSPAKTEPFGTGVSVVPPTALPMPGISQAPVAPGVSADFPTAWPYRLIWLTGILVLVVFFIAAYLKCRREFRESLPVDKDFALNWLKAHKIWRTIRLRQSDRISAPLTYGVFRPVILLPKRTDWSDETTLAYVLTHEYVHIRRFDAVAKLVLTTAFCVHWFNPAVWVMYILANRDMELSCDEAVIHLFGEHMKSAYAMTLIRMEETRSGLRPFCSNFSKHAMKERIVAIMKIKKTTWITAVAALALVFGVTTAFATSAQAQAQDDGGTWPPLTNEEFYAESAWNDVEWWTEEEYADWLEQEKVALQSVIGERGWNPTDGWYTWTQEMVDEAIARYEQTLKDIRNGQKISKPTADGDTMIQFGYNPAFQMTTTDIRAVLGSAAVLDSITDDAVISGNAQTLTPELLADYKAYGVTYDEAKEAFYFNGELVRYFFDGYAIENGVATIYHHVNEDGVVDIHTVRRATQNADGSIDPGGKLAGVEEYSKEEFDHRFFMIPTMTQEAVSFGFVGSTDGVTFEERFAKYKDFGIIYVEANGASGRGIVYLNGQLVSHFLDMAPDGDVFSFTSAEQGGISVQAVYDSSGNLTGLETAANGTAGQN